MSLFSFWDQRIGSDLFSSRQKRETKKNSWLVAGITGANEEDWVSHRPYRKPIAAGEKGWHKEDHKEEKEQTSENARTNEEWKTGEQNKKKTKQFFNSHGALAIH